MDRITIDAYDTAAQAFADEWRDQPAPADMYALLTRHFAPGGRTADIGCGAGRDVAWLNANGFPAVGYDASPGLLEQARTRHPDLHFFDAALPALDGIDDASFDNILCETVIMHLRPDDIGDACSRLLAILKPGGVLYLSWRVSEGESRRDASGRLYASFDAAVVTAAMRNATIVSDTETVNQSSGKRVRRLIVRRAS
ncbi:SAM-dependent methyltransferase [Burkholderia ubonensis]|uniref:class I SAM-dependent methyltransferase n=1 Tax=Burkholderia ubonensis TaxID=101571 RepID=UPI0007588883|nr:class I SAM-dependent methyltransferase [Burkholderia ubonensis]KVR15436.1 SAM-dependent methyltransferase [Burkholderia ubonensis]